MEIIAGKYRILKSIAEGASGKVFLVEHIELGVKYALKILQTPLAEDDKFIERFKQEASVLLRFTHPGSIQLRDFGRTEDGHYYMTMDYCDGISLKDLLEEEECLSVEESLEFMEQILSVLEASHKAGIVHRDIKPENLMVVENDDDTSLIKVMDFGIAKLLETASIDSGLTIEGATIGTPQYMSPEQAAGESDVDERTDIYSCGVLLYEMLCGRTPFEDESIVKTLLLQITKLPDPFDPSLEIPPYVQAVVDTALKKKKGDRFSSARDFRDACLACLKRFEEEQDSPKEEPPPEEVQQGDVSVEETVVPEKEGARILFLDDDQMVLNIMKHLLEKEGYVVFTISEPSEIDRYIFTEKVELLISDIQMPGMPGTAVCKLLKAIKSDLKIILFSNISERDLERSAKECSADTWLSKNADPPSWISTVKQVLAK